VIPYSFHPEAEAELADAAVFYESRLVGLGKSFVAEVERTVSLIREHPDAGVPLSLPRQNLFSSSRSPISVGGPGTGSGA
jgi:hypothetical protein